MIIQAAGALCYRRGPDGLEILLITSRNNCQWVIPKGQPEPHLTWAELAEQEAYEEAGVHGLISEPALGTYERRGRTVLVYPMEVLQELAEWPERGQRERVWLSQAEAAAQVREPKLRAMIAAFAP